MSLPDATFNDYPMVADREIANLVAPIRRTFNCPKCSLQVLVRPQREYFNWHYRMECPECGTLASVLYRLKTQCPQCHKFSFASDKNPTGGCIACRKKTLITKDPF